MFCSRLKDVVATVLAVCVCYFGSVAAGAQESSRKAAKLKEGEPGRASKVRRATTTSTASAELPPLADPADLSGAQLSLGAQVFVGEIECDAGQRVSLTRDVPTIGKFLLQHGEQQHIVVPIPTSTGAIRLESPGRGVMWLQVRNKSMLFDGKTGKRLADECVHADQAAFAASGRSTRGLFD